MAQAKQRPPTGKRQPNKPAAPPQAPKNQPTEAPQKQTVAERRAQRAAEAQAQQKRRQMRFLLIGLVAASVVAVIAFFYIREQLAVQSTGVAVADEGGGHVSPGTPLTYQHYPPSSGKHFDQSQPAGIYAQQEVEEGYWVHSLEHGYVVALVNCTDNCGPIFEQLEDMYDNTLKDSAFGNVKFIATKYSKPFTNGHTPPVTLVAWNNELELTLNNGQIDRQSIQRFYDKFVDKGPEYVP